MKWERAYEVIKLVRQPRNAPVDEFGPKSIADQKAPKAVFQYHVLCALQLSSQTRDQNTALAIRQLQAHGLTVDNIAKTSVEDLQELIRPVGFYRKKAEYMKSTAQVLLAEHAGLVPNNLDSLLALPGVGPKMAHLTLAEAFDQITGIGVDTHCHRIANQLGWVKSTTPIQTQNQLELLIPREEWYRVNLELVGLGQMVQQTKQYRARLVGNLLGIDSEEDFTDAVYVLKRMGFTLTKDEEALRPTIKAAAATTAVKKKSKHFEE
ncbi:hypothetical protein BASA81_001384 [Batrachochytrium salamandrivorans]|nr:hypothetical protein BASA81_001384 [Batrachochytrium salamandrivorans]